jgi:hypothetical protein
MKKVAAALCVCLSILLGAVTVQAEVRTAEGIMGNSTEWVEFTSIWNNSAGRVLGLHPYYQLHFAFYITMSEDELSALSDYMLNSKLAIEKKLNNPAIHKWDWLDESGTLHTSAEWTSIPFWARAEAMKNVLANWEAFDFTYRKLIPLATFFMNADSFPSLSQWFSETYSAETARIDFNMHSHTLRRDLMDSLGFENWPLPGR